MKHRRRHRSLATVASVIIEKVEPRLMLTNGLFFNYSPDQILSPEPYTFRLDVTSISGTADWQIFRVEAGVETLQLSIPDGGLEQTLDPGPGEYIVRITDHPPSGGTVISEGCITVGGGPPTQIIGPTQHDFTTSPTLQWTAVDGANGYEVEVFDATRGEVLTTVNVVSATSLNLPTVMSDTAGVLYRVSVRAVFADAPATAWTTLEIENTLDNLRTPVVVSGGIGEQLTQQPELYFISPSAPRVAAATHEIIINPVGNRSDITYSRIVDHADSTGNSTAHAVEDFLPTGDYEVWVQTTYSDGTRSRWDTPSLLTITVGAIKTAPQMEWPNSDITNLRRTLSWSGQANDVAYQLWVSPVNNTASPVINLDDLTSTTFTPSFDLPADTYNAWVRAVRTGGVKSDWSSAVRFAVHPHGVDPIVITAGTGQQMTTTPVIQCEGVPNVKSGYEIFISAADAPTVPVYSRTGINGTSHELETPLQSGIDYQVWVRATYDINIFPTSTSRWGSPYSLVIGDVTAGGDSTDPVSFTAGTGNQANTTPVIEWQSRNHVERYDLYINVVGNRSVPVYRQTNLTTNSHQLSTPLTDDTSYEVWVRVHYTDGTKTRWSLPAELHIGSAQTNSTTPISFTAGIGNQTDVTPVIEWEQRANVTNYDLYINEVGNRSTPVYRRTDLQSHTHEVQNALTDNTEYEVWIRAFYSDGTQTLWGPPATLTIGTSVPDFSQTIPQVRFETGSAVWDSVTSAVRYELWVNQYDSSSNLLQSAVFHDVNLTSSSVSLNLSTGIFRMWLRAYDSSDGTTRWSAPTSFTIS